MQSASSWLIAPFSVPSSIISVLAWSTCLASRQKWWEKGTKRSGDHRSWRFVQQESEPQTACGASGRSPTKEN